MRTYAALEKLRQLKGIPQLLALMSLRNALQGEPGVPPDRPKRGAPGQLATAVKKQKKQPRKEVKTRGSQSRSKSLLEHFQVARLDRSFTLIQPVAQPARAFVGPSKEVAVK
jgi:hypothetical protein